MLSQVDHFQTISYYRVEYVTNNEDREEEAEKNKKAGYGGKASHGNDVIILRVSDRNTPDS